MDKSRLLQNYKKNINKTYCILNYTRIKRRSRPPQKKIRIFYAPRFFSGQNRKKSAQITRANTVFTIINDVISGKTIVYRHR